MIITKTKQIFYASTYFLTDLVSYINISNLIKLLRCNKQLYKQIYITYKYIIYPIPMVLNWKIDKQQYVKNLLIDDCKLEYDFTEFPNSAIRLRGTNFNVINYSL
jgi:hypothetical protein